MTAPSYIVDSHVHFWDPSRLEYPWLGGLPTLNRAFLPADYALATQAVPVRKVIFVESGCLPSLNRDEVRWISELAEPLVHGIVAHAEVENRPRIREDLAALAKFPLVKGIRRNLQGESAPGFCLQPDFIAGVQLLAEFGFTFDLCLLPHQLPDAIELARRCPAVTFVLDHCAKPELREKRFDPWAASLKALSELPNVSCKLSGLITEAHWNRWTPLDLQPFIAHALDCFGFDRVLFGGDWPVLNLAGDYSGWLNALQSLLAHATEEEARKLLQTNAEKIYQI